MGKNSNERFPFLANELVGELSASRLAVDAELRERIEIWITVPRQGDPTGSMEAKRVVASYPLDRLEGNDLPLRVAVTRSELSPTYKPPLSVT